jgi:hypothetical protein
VSQTLTQAGSVRSSVEKDTRFFALSVAVPMVRQQRRPLRHHLRDADAGSEAGIRHAVTPRAKAPGHLVGETWFTISGFILHYV